MSESSPGKDRRAIGRLLVVAVLVLALLLVGAAAVSVLSGRSLPLGLWQVSHLVRAMADRGTVTTHNQGDYTSIIFLHHSTGANLIAEGQVREMLTEAGYDFWDHHYNPTGLRDPSGELTGYSYRIPNDNTDPDGLARLFAQRAYPWPVNALSGLLQHEVIVFKSCFPASQINSDAQLEQYQAWYLAMRDVMDAHPERVFVVVSPPPLHPAATDPAAAVRARAFADWLSSEAYLAGHANIFAFDLFDHLAESDPNSPEVNMLRAAYRPDDIDSHPNQAANQAVGPAFAKALIEAARSYASRA